MEERFTTSDRLATLSLFGLGVFVDIRGFYWAVKQNDVLSDSEFYQALHRLMPIWIWGILLLIFGTFLMLASVFYARHSVKKKSNYFMLIGGVGSAIIHFLMASASIYNSINWLTPLQFVAMTAWLGFVGFIGGLNIYGRR